MKKERYKKQYAGWRYPVFIWMCAIILFLAAGCAPAGEVQPEQSVQIATAGSETIDKQGTTQQEIVYVPDDKKTQIPEAAPQNENPYGIDPLKPMVALTFDDGPSKYTWDIVHSLQTHRARGTFFLMGSRVINHQAAIDYTLANHNEIASHGFSHKDMVKLTEDEMVEEIRLVDAAMEQQHQYTPRMFRVPYGNRDEVVLSVLAAEEKPVIGWSVDPYDWKVKDKETIVNHVLNSVQDGDIILLHDIYEPTAQAVEELVPALQERGYQIVTVSELFQFRGITPEPGVYYKKLPPEEATE